jgi:hypothetical protein
MLVHGSQHLALVAFSFGCLAWFVHKALGLGGYRER